MKKINIQHGNCKVMLLVLLTMIPFSCGKVTFNMSGASIGNASTCQVGYFENRADIVNPRLSTQITDALKDKIQASTSLKLVNSNADVMFEGEITGYTVQPQQVTAMGTAAKDRLTVTVKVKFTNALEADNSFDKSFSRFQEYTGGTSLSSVEGQLVEDILKEMMEDIFNEAFSSW
ncbi:MAG: LPS assembly lipoprotein LptE [Bacteroidales bacterium]|jgi:hypothetical protein|nr:LPS assembly lipoprotein LptE [Bacteroidales bacterium]